MVFAMLIINLLRYLLGYLSDQLPVKNEFDLFVGGMKSLRLWSILLIRLVLHDHWYLSR